MKHFPRVEDISAKDFELQVLAWLNSSASTVESFSSEHREVLTGVDGEYEIDVVVRFQGFEGAKFLVLVECKKHKNPIKRELVQTLRQKQLSLGAHKAMIFSTSDFQSGAIEFARVNGIALVQLVCGAMAYVQANVGGQVVAPSDNAEDYAGIFYGLGSKVLPQPFTTARNYGIDEYLKVLRESGL